MKKKLYGTYIEKTPYDITVEYYLTEEFLCERYSEIKRYGVIVKKTALGKTEKKQINDIFYRLCDAEEFVYLLLRNKVTPLALEDIVNQYITSKITVTA